MHFLISCASISRHNKLRFKLSTSTFLYLNMTGLLTYKLFFENTHDLSAPLTLTGILLISGISLNIKFSILNIFNHPGLKHHWRRFSHLTHHSLYFHNLCHVMPIFYVYFSRSKLDFIVFPNNTSSMQSTLTGETIIAIQSWVRRNCEKAKPLNLCQRRHQENLGSKNSPTRATNLQTRSTINPKSRFLGTEREPSPPDTLLTTTTTTIDERLNKLTFSLSRMERILQDLDAKVDQLRNKEASIAREWRYWL
jgi:hypothetical protein